MLLTKTKYFFIISIGILTLIMQNAVGHDCPDDDDRYYNLDKYKRTLILYQLQMVLFTALLVLQRRASGLAWGKFKFLRANEGSPPQKKRNTCHNSMFAFNYRKHDHDSRDDDACCSSCENFPQWAIAIIVSSLRWRSRNLPTIFDEMQKFIPSIFILTYKTNLNSSIFL